MAEGHKTAAELVREMAERLGLDITSGAPADTEHFTYSEPDITVEGEPQRIFDFKFSTPHNDPTDQAGFYRRLFARDASPEDDWPESARLGGFRAGRSARAAEDARNAAFMPEGKIAPRSDDIEGTASEVVDEVPLDRRLPPGGS